MYLRIPSCPSDFFCKIIGAPPWCCCTCVTQTLQSFDNLSEFLLRAFSFCSESVFFIPIFHLRKNNIDNSFQFSHSFFHHLYLYDFICSFSRIFTVVLFMRSVRMGVPRPALPLRRFFNPRETGFVPSEEHTSG